LLSRDTDTPDALLAESIFLSPADNMPAASLAESLVSSSRRPHAHCAACRIARFFHVSISYPPYHTLNCSFLAVDDHTPTALLAESLVSFYFDILPTAPLAVSLVCFS
jgi:hypothetical protein